MHPLTCFTGIPCNGTQNAVQKFLDRAPVRGNQRPAGVVMGALKNHKFFRLRCGLIKLLSKVIWDEIVLRAVGEELGMFRRGTLDTES